MAEFTSRLRRASARLRGTAATEIPVPFSVACQCGQQISGIRLSTSQQISCSRCDAIVYVLPVNVYPATERVSSEVVGGSLARRLLAASRDFFPGRTLQDVPKKPPARPVQMSATPAAEPINTTPDHSEQPLTMPPRRGEMPGQSPSLQDALDGNTAAPPAPIPEVIPSTLPANTTTEPFAAPVAKPRRLKLPEIDYRRVARRTLTPFRVLMLAAVSVVLLTGWYTVHRNQLERARRTWREAMDAADAALNSQNLTDLQTALQKAVAAAGTLDRDDAESRSAANQLLEATAINRLSPGDLVSDLGKGYGPDGQLSADRIRSISRTLVTGCHLFECPVQISDATQSTVRLLLPLQVGNDSVNIEVQSAALAKAAGGLGRQSLLIVAEVESCTPPQQSPGTWQISLNPDLCVLLTHEAFCIAAGIDPAQAPGLADQIRRQRIAVAANDLQMLRAQDQPLRNTKQTE